jgi:hypothetical protein
MVTINETPNTTFVPTSASTGFVYAITATGNFTMARSFADITLGTTDVSTIISRDTIDAIQINIPVSSINALLGITGTGLSTTYDMDIGKFTDGGSISSDTLSITGANLASWVTAPSQIVKTGKYSTLYSQFKTFVSGYFGLPGNFASLYDNSGRLAFTDGTATVNSTGVAVGDVTTDGLYNLLKGTTPLTTEAGGGGTGSVIGGTITIADVSKLLRFAVDTNVFNNRPAADDYGVGDGFAAGDLIFVTSGVTTTLTIGLTMESDPTPMNVIKTMSRETFADGSTTTATTSLLTRTHVAPILLRITA